MKINPGYWRFCVRLWRRETAEKLRWRIAWMIPRSIALLVFVRVYSAAGDLGPDDEYQRVYQIWQSGAGR